ncbi:MAG: glycosyltransferase, partial [Geminocystis sp. GBBB08]|nr:glycosyltransferase [Geminocystis sp. GBBB08]
MNQWHPSAQEYWLKQNYDQVIKIYEEIINNNTGEITDYFYLGLAYLMKGEIDIAQSIWMSVLLDIDNFDLEFNNLLTILDQQGFNQIQKGTLESALIIYQNLEDLLSNREENKPEYAYYYWRIGLIYTIHDKLPLAESCFLQAIDIAQVKEAYNELGGIYFNAGLMEKTIEVYRQQIKAHPNYFASHVNLIASLSKFGNIKEAIEAASSAQKQFPDDLLWTIRKHLILPSLYQNQEEITIYKNRFIEGLNIVIQEAEKLDLENPEIKKKALNALVNNINFELAYQCFNHKDLQQKYGNLVYKIMSANYPQWIQPKTKKSLKSKIRVGYVSGCMCEHVVSKLTHSWLVHHDRDQFEIYSYYIRDKYDQITKQYEQNSHKFYHISSFEPLCQQISEDDLDVLVFVEIGMFATMTILASLRFAPVQCTTWAHPETSGLSNIDYFLSSDLMEPENGQEHYSEKLIRLPNLGICYPKPPIPELSRTRDFFDLPEDAIVYFCSQSIFKYLPQHDYILATIAKKVPQSKFLFLTRPNPNLANQFKKRLAISFRQLELNVDDYCLFLPPLIRQEYLNLNFVSDVFLDSLG